MAARRGGRNEHNWYDGGWKEGRARVGGEKMSGCVVIPHGEVAKKIAKRSRGRERTKDIRQSQEGGFAHYPKRKLITGVSTESEFAAKIESDGLFGEIADKTCGGVGVYFSVPIVE